MSTSAHARGPHLEASLDESRCSVFPIAQVYDLQSSQHLPQPHATHLFTTLVGAIRVLAARRDVQTV